MNAGLADFMADREVNRLYGMFRRLSDSEVKEKGGIMAVLKEAPELLDATQKKAALLMQVYPDSTAVQNAMERLIQRPAVHLIPAAGSTAAVDEGQRFVYGVLPGTTDVASCFTATEGGSLRFTPASCGSGTGSTLTLIDPYGEAVESFTLVIFGDVNGDQRYDGTDAYLVRLIVNGMIPSAALTDAQRLAADCNHDGTVDSLDAAILVHAGLLLESVDQSLPADELAANSIYLDYCGLIDQTIIPADETPSAQPQEPAAEPVSIVEQILTFFRHVQIWLFNILFVKI